MLLFLLLLLLGIFSTQFLTAAGSFLVEDDGIRKADAAVVLGGDTFGDRTLQAAELAKAGYVPLIYVSGPPRLMGYESADEIQFAEQKGYSPALFQDVHLRNYAETTRTEAQFMGQLLRDKGVKSILLVTSNFHSKRAAKLWREANPWLDVSVVPSVDPEHYFTPTGWWKTRTGQKLFLFEWLKTISVMLGV